MTQDQFLDVIDRDEAEERFRRALDLSPLGIETINLTEALGRTCARDVTAEEDVPGFDRSNVDGWAVRTEDTVGATEDQPNTLRVNPEVIATGVVPRDRVEPGTATRIATGGVLPRGADAVVMVEDSAYEEGADTVLIRRPVPAGGRVSFAGSDVSRGESVVRAGVRLTSRETGVLAAVGCRTVEVYRRPRVAILSTGDEVVAPGRPLPAGHIYDSNAAILRDGVREQGGVPINLGIVPDDLEATRIAIRWALEEHRADVVLLSGGTSKGEGDVCHKAVSELRDPGLVAHGVALKPGKPVCLAATPGPGGRTAAVVVLPGFPTSAVFTFHEFVAPVLRALGGRRADLDPELVRARLPMRVNSEKGRTEYLLVSLLPNPEPGEPPGAWPLGKGSGSVTAFGRADGFVRIPRLRERVDRDEDVHVRLLGRDVRPADLVVIGSHDPALDRLLGLRDVEGWGTWQHKALWVGSNGGLEAARRSQCDVAGIHLLDPETGAYNAPYVPEGSGLVRGWIRRQGIALRPDDPLVAEHSLDEAADADWNPEAAWERGVDLARLLVDGARMMAGRNRGSGTRVLADRLLTDAGDGEMLQPDGAGGERSTHSAVCSAVLQDRADWGVTVESAARMAGLVFVPVAEEHYDFLVPAVRRARPAVRAFLDLLDHPATAQVLQSVHCRRPEDA